jgi:hypothetical protein
MAAPVYLDGFERAEAWMRWHEDASGNPARHVTRAEGKTNTTGFDMERFRRAIQEHGDRMRWEQASRCPCAANDDTGQPDPTCDTCHGKAWEYHSPEPVRGIVDRLEYRIDALEKLGDWAFGGCMVTLDPLHRPNFRDRFILLDAVKPHSELVARGPADRADRLAYPVQPVEDVVLVGEGDEQVRRKIKVGVRRLRVMDEATRTPGAIRREGIDFAVTPNGCIDWSLGDALGTAPRPAEGRRRGGRYAITFMHNPSYLVGNYPYPLRVLHVHGKRPDWVHLQGPVSAFCSMEYRQDTPGAPTPDG